METMEMMERERERERDNIVYRSTVDYKQTTYVL